MEWRDMFECKVIKSRAPSEEMLQEFLDMGIITIPEQGQEEEGTWNNYLCKEDIINSLVREKKGRLSGFNPDEFLESLSERIMLKKSIGERIHYAENVVNRSIVTPMLLKLGEQVLETSASEVDFSWLSELMGPGTRIEDLRENEQRMLSILLEKSGVPNSKAVGVCLINPRGIRFSLSLSGNLKENYRKGGRIFRGQRGRVYYNRDGYSIAKIYVRKKIAQLFQEHIKGVQGCLDDDVVYRYVRNDVESLLSNYLNEGEIQLLLRDPYGKYALPNELPDQYVVQNVACRLGLRYEFISDLEVADGRGGSRKALDQVGVSRIYGLEAALMPEMQFHLYNKYNDVPGFDWDYAELMQEAESARVLSYLYGAYKDRKELNKELKELEQVGRADVYQTKKNIPEKYKEAMQNSSFNETFGFVEIDAECDLNLIREIEREFLALKEDGFLKEQDCKSIAIRFRKLHRYRADGLYFPGLRCLCVDVRNPSTFVHEAFHLVDFERGNLSMGYAFQPVRQEYERILRDGVNNAPGGLKKTLMGTSKYNLDYYLKPTEVFARCGEIYMTRIRGIKNSLCRPDAGFAYPEREGNEKLYELIAGYYPALFMFKEKIELDISKEG